MTEIKKNETKSEPVGEMFALLEQALTKKYDTGFEE